MSLSSPERCPYCGQVKHVAKTELFGIEITAVLKCQCEIDAFDREMQRIKEYDERQRKAAMRKNSGLIGATQEMTFENFSHRPGTEKALQVAQEFVAHIDQRLRTGEAFTLLGGYGNGKSHLAAAVVHELISKGITASYQPVTELLKRVKASYDGSGEKESGIMEFLQNVQALVLDDIGAQKMTEWAEEFLYTVIDHRYRCKLPTIVTSNCGAVDGKKSLTEALGGRSVDRLLERNVFVLVKATSYRRELARQRMKS